MLSVSSTHHDFGHIDSPGFSKKEWLLPIEKLGMIIGFFKRPKQEIEDPEELQKYCFAQVVKTCVKSCRKNDYKIIVTASKHLFGLLDEHRRSIYQAVIEDEKDPETVKKFLQDIKQDRLPKYSLTHRDYKLSLHYAARANRGDLFLYVKHRKLNRKDAEGKTALHAAIENGSTEFVAKLLELTKVSEPEPESTPSLEARFKDPRTEVILSPFSLAIMMGRIECFDLLVEHSIDNECFNEIISNVGNFLHLAILFGQTNILKHLLSKYLEKINKLINSQNGHPSGFTPFSLATSHGDIEAMLLLINHGADIERPDYEQKRALHHAVIARQEDAINLLLMLGAKKAPKDHFGKDPCTYAKGKDPISIEIKDNLTTSPSNFPKNSSPNFYTNYPENLVFQGGGPKGVAYVGALDVLEKRGILDHVKRVAGTSAGAITATFLALGYSVDEAKEHLMAMQLIELLDFDGARLSEIIPETKQKAHDLNHASGFFNKAGAVIRLLGLLKFTCDFVAIIIGQLKNKSGLCKGEFFRQWIAKAIEQKTGDANLTFGELRGLISPRSRYKHLYVFTTKIGANKEIVQLDSEDERWDNLIIADAVRASMSIPGAFEAHNLHYKDRPGPLGHRLLCEGQSFSDGGIIYNLPVEAFDKKKYIKKGSISKEEGECPAFNKRTLAFSLYTPGEEVPKEDTTVTTTYEVIGDVLKTRWHAESITRKRVEYNKHRIINISNIGVGTSEFDLAPEKMEQLILSGKESVEDFFEEQAKSSKTSTQIFFDTTNEQLASLVRQANKKAPVNAQGRNGVTQLHTAVLSEDIEKIKKLLQDPRIDVNIQDDNGDTPLHLTLCARYPAPSNRKEIFQLLIKHPDIDVNIQNKVGDTPVHHAVTLFSEEILRKTTPNLRGRNGFTLLHIAANFGCLEIAAILLENPKTDVNIQTDRGATALHLCTSTGKMKIFHLLVRHPKIDVNLQECRGRTILHEALTMCQNMEAIGLLMEREDIKINIQDNNGHTPLHLSLLPGCMEAFNLFVRHPTIDLNIQDHDGRTPLHFALFPTCGLLLKQQNGWIREKGLHEDKLLHLSEFPYNLKALSFLLQCSGVKVNLQDKSGRTPLHSSILSNNREAFQLLSQHPEINMEILDNRGISPQQLIEIKRQAKERREQPRKVVNEDNGICTIS